MQNLRKILIGLLVALAIVIPLTMAVLATAPSGNAIVKIADGPTPTPTQDFNGGNSGCHGLGC